jgi:ubiquinone/menaquinone biosynthesis C-methylase UbiE
MTSPDPVGPLNLGTAASAEEVRDYYRQSETYDWVAAADHFVGPETFFHRHRARLVRRLVEQYAVTPVLDAGCGTGLILRHLPVGSTGLDINPRNLTMVAQRIPNATLVLGDLEALPFAPGDFATVVCTEVLEHVPDISAALAEIRRVLRPGGYLLGSVPADSWLWRLRFLSRTCPHSEPFHHQYRTGAIRTLLETAGFVECAVRYSFPRFHVVFVARRP